MKATNHHSSVSCCSWRARLSLLSALVALTALPVAARAEAKLKVIVTISSYAPIARDIGGNKVEVSHIILGHQDPHTVRPKPSFAKRLSTADLLVATGLDLESWLPYLIDASGNRKIMSGQPGYVAVSAGIEIGEKPKTLDRSAGDVHVFGNPHIHTSPLNGKIIAENITIGLRRVAPQHAKYFEANLARFKEETDRRLFGEELVTLLGGKTLCRLAQNGKLYDFLAKKSYKGTPLLDRLGGWMKAALPLRGQKIVTYHPNWGYFTDLFGIEVAGQMEPKPGIPPTPKHVAGLINRMRQENVHLLLAANYFDVAKVRQTAEKAGATPVITALAVGGMKGMDSFYDQFDIWIRELVAGLKKTKA